MAHKNATKISLVTREVYRFIIKPPQYFHFSTNQEINESDTKSSWIVDITNQVNILSVARAYRAAMISDD